MNRNKKIDIIELAKILKLSKSTISRAFTNSDQINSKTKERILKKAEELNYRPNIYASSLRERKSRTIAVIMPELANNFFSQAVKGIEQIARSKNYHTLIYVTDSEGDKEIDITENLLNGRVEGVIMSATGEGRNPKHIKKMQQHIPVVFFDRVYNEIQAPKVVTDDYDSSFKATELLIKNGCKKIAFFVINKNISIGNERLNGYTDALKANDIKVNERLILNCSNDFDENYNLISTFLKTKKPDGILASVERLAISTYIVCNDLKIIIPDEIKLICYSSLPIASLLNPSLSTITQPSYDMGISAAELLFNDIENKNRSAETLILASSIFERTSSMHNV